MRPDARLGWIAALPACLFLLVFAVAPLAVLVRNSLGIGETGLTEQAGFTFDYYLSVFTTPALQRSLGNSILVSVMSVLITIAIAVPFVLELAKRERAGKRSTIADALVTMPIALPGTVIGFFAIVLIGNTGLLARVFPGVAGMAYLLPGVLLAYVYFSLPRVIGPLRGAAQALDPALTETARSLGAPRWRVFRTITWPLLLPAVIESSGTALATAFGGYGTIATLSQGIRLLPLDVVDQLSTAGYNVAAASATAVVLGLLSIVFLALGQLGSAWLRRGGSAPVSRRGASLAAGGGAALATGDPTTLTAGEAPAVTTGGRA
ncbi:ABC transporter permease subunit [Pseudoclavibacter chungangensis]|uniref:ABC transporter permease subunit n=1 Tax=Pseudoclavibacter chungangensis TaxID=587635 RepID=A0A7J5C464_9MICO|nr:ABC transporter permease subunit [Pseudoclavibacter chungangensis]KAB1662569.1 ABC transporter permease subunit [Pseudoclavibacter chungangensis]NYJ68614.1 putative spermidine/putrescine transport system permease protein [Pseudoclavibacter chungangensis]